MDCSEENEELITELLARTEEIHQEIESHKSWIEHYEGELSEIESQLEELGY